MVKLYICLGTQSAGLLKLKKLRYTKYNKKHSLRTALDDLYSLEKNSTEMGKIGESQCAGRSKVVQSLPPIDSTDVTSTDLTTDDEIPTGISFDKLHPPFHFFPLYLSHSSTFLICTILFQVLSGYYTFQVPG